ncbi:MAG TPA: hypothetical protein DDY14_09165 [Chromatiaceae bacterium]|nr:MAG: hypothetical protein N838_15235 [Thiohalocapsa sp. PB-PSB1]HBG95473.1 hypothetical protein [Chromatiaceae bacterium]HCS89049.1 hypothetical protein [Chromatiaceae bacterium]
MLASDQARFSPTVQSDHRIITLFLINKMRWGNVLIRITVENTGFSHALKTPRMRLDAPRAGTSFLRRDQGAIAMSLDLSLHNPSALDGLAMRTAAKKKLAASVNTRNLFHRLCQLHRLNRRHNGHWQAGAALEQVRRAR